MDSIPLWERTYINIAYSLYVALRAQTENWGPFLLVIGSIPTLSYIFPSNEEFSLPAAAEMQQSRCSHHFSYRDCFAGGNGE